MCFKCCDPCIVCEYLALCECSSPRRGHLEIKDRKRIRNYKILPLDNPDDYIFRHEKYLEVFSDDIKGKDRYDNIFKKHLIRDIVEIGSLEKYTEEEKEKIFESEINDDKDYFSFCSKECVFAYLQFTNQQIEECLEMYFSWGGMY